MISRNNFNIEKSSCFFCPRDYTVWAGCKSLKGSLVLSEIDFFLSDVSLSKLSASMVKKHMKENNQALHFHLNPQLQISILVPSMKEYHLKGHKTCLS